MFFTNIAIVSRFSAPQPHFPPLPTLSRPSHPEKTALIRTETASHPPRPEKPPKPRMSTTIGPSRPEKRAPARTRTAISPPRPENPPKTRTRTAISPPRPENPPKTRTGTASRFSRPGKRAPNPDGGYFFRAERGNNSSMEARGKPVHRAIWAFEAP